MNADPPASAGEVGRSRGGGAAPVARGPRQRRAMFRRTGAIPWLLLTPVLGLFLVVFVLPLLYLFLFSLSPESSFEPDLDRVTVHNYVTITSDPFYLSILWRTLRLSLLSTFAALLIGYPIAYYISKSAGRKRSYLILLTVTPLFVNVVAMTFGWYVIMGPAGILNWLTGGRVTLLYTETAVVIGLTHVYLPFMVLSVAAALQNIDANLTNAAHSLGANRFQTFLRVTWPLSLPGVSAGGLIVFILSAGSFATPLLLGGSANPMIAAYIYQESVSLLNWPLAGTLAFFLMVTVAVLSFAYIKFVGFERKGGR